MIKIKAQILPDGEGWEAKDIFLRKDGEKGFIGLHAIGMTREDDQWHAIEGWVNSYHADKRFEASIARMFGPIEQAAEDFISDGWIVVDWSEDGK